MESTQTTQNRMDVDEFSPLVLSTPPTFYLCHVGSYSAVSVVSGPMDIFKFAHKIMDLYDNLPFPCGECDGEEEPNDEAEDTSLLLKGLFGEVPSDFDPCYKGRRLIHYIISYLRGPFTTKKLTKVMKPFYIYGKRYILVENINDLLEFQATNAK